MQDNISVLYKTLKKDNWDIEDSEQLFRQSL